MQGVKTFSAMELLTATKNFSGDSIIGLGGFGNAYFSIQDDGRQGAIKRAVNTELSSLVSITRISSHCLASWRQTTSLYWCWNTWRMALLQTQLHFRRSPAIMYWMARIRVARDAATGIYYLHNSSDLPIIHRDVKSSNIYYWTSIGLEKYRIFGSLYLLVSMRVGDSSQLVGTKGYIDPQYYFSQQLTSASDVCGFGIVLLELLSGRTLLHRDETGNLCHIMDLIVPLTTRGEFDAALDPSMPKPTAIEMASFTDMAYHAYDCVSLTAALSCLSGTLARLLINESDSDGYEDNSIEGHTVGR